MTVFDKNLPVSVPLHGNGNGNQTTIERTSNGPRMDAERITHGSIRSISILFYVHVCMYIHVRIWNITASAYLPACVIDKTYVHKSKR